MAYDEDLADRIRVAIGNAVDVNGLVTEKRMFGGLAFLLGGNMAVAASGQGGVMLRVDPEETETLLAQPHAAPTFRLFRPIPGSRNRILSASRFERLAIQSPCFGPFARKLLRPNRLSRSTTFHQCGS